MKKYLVLILAILMLVGPAVAMVAAAKLRSNEPWVAGPLVPGVALLSALAVRARPAPALLSAAGLASSAATYTRRSMRKTSMDTN